jgi:hypothetical protein
MPRMMSLLNRGGNSDKVRVWFHARASHYTSKERGSILRSHITPGISREARPHVHLFVEAVFPP